MSIILPSDITTVQLVRETCCSCGVVFAMTKEFYQECSKNTDKWFYCPNGHKQHYTTSEADRQKRRAERAEALATRLTDERDTAERRRRDWNLRRWQAVAV